MPTFRPTVISSAISAAVIAFAVAATTTMFMARTRPNVGSVETAYDHIMRTHKLRVGYINYPPGTQVDPTGHQITGIFPDLTRRIGMETSLKVEFVEEVGWGNLIEGLQTKRYDIIGGIWENPVRAKFTLSSTPVYYSGIGVWVRSQENRFTETNEWSSINKPDINVGAIDGSTPLEIIHDQFSQAHVVTYPNLTTEPQLFTDLVSGKIDVFFAEPSQGALFLSHNPNTIKNVAASAPLRVFPDVFLMNADEVQLKSLIDTSIFDLATRGVVGDLIKKYQPLPGAFYQTRLPYEQDSK